MELYQVKPGSKVRLLPTEGHTTPPGAQESVLDKVYTFIKLDGMYSICKTEEDKIVYLIAWANVEVIEEYKE